jgi:hypothetical protein
MDIGRVNYVLAKAIVGLQNAETEDMAEAIARGLSSYQVPSPTKKGTPRKRRAPRKKGEPEYQERPPVVPSHAMRGWKKISADEYVKGKWIITRGMGRNAPWYIWKNNKKLRQYQFYSADEAKMQIGILEAGG